MHYITPYLVNITQSNDPPAVSLALVLGPIFLKEKEKLTQTIPPS